MRKPLTMSAPTKLVTADELLQLLDDDVLYELVEGRLIRVSRPGAQHSPVSMRLGSALYQFVTQRRLGIVFAQDAGFKLASNPDTVRGPDVSFVRAELLRGSDVPRGYWPGPPDLAVEVTSPNDRRSAIAMKIEEYLRAGVRMVWLIDPNDRTLTVHRPSAAPITLAADQAVDGDDVVPGFSLPIRALFEDLGSQE